MLVIRFKSSSKAKDLLKKVRKMSKYSEELEDILFQKFSELRSDNE